MTKVDFATSIGLAASWALAGAFVAGPPAAPAVVMMPPTAASWTTEARQAALVHELTHVKRGDRRTQAIAQIAAAILNGKRKAHKA